jgi:hypothetical protein
MVQQRPGTRDTSAGRRNRRCPAQRWGAHLADRRRSARRFPGAEPRRCHPGLPGVELHQAAVAGHPGGGGPRSARVARTRRVRSPRRGTLRVVDGRRIGVDVIPPQAAVSVTGVSQRFDRLVVRAALPPVQLHDLWRLAASLIYRATRDLELTESDARPRVRRDHRAGLHVGGRGLRGPFVESPRGAKPRVERGGRVRLEPLPGDHESARPDADRKSAMSGRACCAGGDVTAVRLCPAVIAAGSPIRAR